MLSFAALTVAWTWPLVLHLTNAIPGEGGGDGYSFLWNLWWMRHALAAPGGGYFHTTHLFYPFGTTVVDQSHTALVALIAATVLRPLSVVTAQNLFVLVHVFANMACAYALVWDIAGDRRAAIFGGVVYGMSPYVAVHLPGHFELIAAWPLPLFALFLRRSLDAASTRAAVAAGAVLGAVAYLAYYYVVYLSLFAALYVLAWVDPVHIAWTRRPPTLATRWIRTLLAGTALAFGAAAVWIVVSGGGTLVVVGGVDVSARTPQNALTVMWLALVAWAFTRWRLSLGRRAIPPDRTRRALLVLSAIAAIFLLAAAPLLWQAVQLVARGEYVTPIYMWRSAPRGIDLLAPLLGPPSHPLIGPSVTRAFARLHLDRVEGVAWIGVVPALLVIAGRQALASREARRWTIVAAGFLLWAFGPFLTIAGFDTGLKLPETLVRFLPVVANARMPGRAMVGVYLALAVLVGLAISHGGGLPRRPALQWLLAALLVFDFWDAPVPLTMLDRPAVYETLAASPPGAVCEVPFGVGDGLSTGAGSQDRRMLYYATIHEHPVVGGYIGRMPADTIQRYESMPFTAALLRLSTNGPGEQMPPSPESAPCTYLVVDRRASTPGLLAFVEQIPADRMADSDDRVLYRLR